MLQRGADMITKPKIKLDPDRVKALAAEGRNQTQIAAMLGVSPDTLTRRKQEDPAVADALRAWRAFREQERRRKRCRAYPKL